MKKQIRIVGVGLLLFAVIISFALFFLYNHAVPIAVFEQVTEGMTQAQVQDITGQPLVIRHDHPNTNAYYQDATVFFTVACRG